jgi:hypothetical protein
MQYTIYFRQKNWDLFKNEDNKSALINDLLTKHYGLAAGATGRLVGSELPKEIQGAVRNVNSSGSPTIRSLAEIMAEEAEVDDGPDMENYAWDYTTGKCFDKSTEEQVPAKLVDGKIVLL